MEPLLESIRVQLEKAASRSNCASRHVGAVLVRDGAVIAASSNGVSSRFADCISAGCVRCKDGGQVGVGYDNCICIHAEQRLVATAAAHGIATSGAALYVSLRPCLQCLLLVFAAGITEVRFELDWCYADSRENSYQTLAGRFAIFAPLEGRDLFSTFNDRNTALRKD